MRRTVRTRTNCRHYTKAVFYPYYTVSKLHYRRFEIRETILLESVMRGVRFSFISDQKHDFTLDYLQLFSSIKDEYLEPMCENSIKDWDNASVRTWQTSVFGLYCIRMTGPNTSNLTHLDHSTVLIFLSHWGLKQKHRANKGQIWNFKEVTHDRTNN